MDIYSLSVRCVQEHKLPPRNIILLLIWSFAILIFYWNFSLSSQSGHLRRVYDAPFCCKFSLESAFVAVWPFAAKDRWQQTKKSTGQLCWPRDRTHLAHTPILLWLLCNAASDQLRKAYFTKSIMQYLSDGRHKNNGMMMCNSFTGISPFSGDRWSQHMPAALKWSHSIVN